MSGSRKSSPSPQMSSGVRERDLPFVSFVAATFSVVGNPFLSSKKSPPPASLFELNPRCNVGVPRPLLGEREDVTN